MPSPPPSPPSPPPSSLPSKPQASSELPPSTLSAPHDLRESQPTYPPSPPDFSPFFTLLTTSTSQTHHHPRIHYVFASDPSDTSPITAAALDVLSTSPNTTTTTSSGSPSRSGEDAAMDGGSRRRSRGRFVLIDMDSSGTKVVSAQSLSPDFAVLSTEVREAPTWEGAGQEEGEGRKGLMLQIEGVEAQLPVANATEGGKKGVEERSLEGLIEEYEKGMRELRGIVEANRLVEEQDH